ncbi:hypothetical protein N8843_04470 [Verrucomicrobia bacterium]|nr:hypothetical protein [Verrucomicrobiota bacterium]
MDEVNVPRKRKWGKQHSLLIQSGTTPQSNFTGGGVVYGLSRQTVGGYLEVPPMESPLI